MPIIAPMPVRHRSMPRQPERVFSTSLPLLFIFIDGFHSDLLLNIKSSAMFSSREDLQCLQILAFADMSSSQCGHLTLSEDKNVELDSVFIFFSLSCLLFCIR